MRTDQPIPEIRLRRKLSICGNCGGKLQNNVTIDAWFHIDPEDLRRCGIANGKPTVTEYLIDTT